MKNVLMGILIVVILIFGGFAGEQLSTIIPQVTKITTQLDSITKTIDQQKAKLAKFEKTIADLVKKIDKLKRIKLPGLKFKHSGQHIGIGDEKWPN